MMEHKEKRPHNSTCKKLAVKWLHEALCFASSSVVADSFCLRNRQLLVASQRYGELNNMLPFCKFVIPLIVSYDSIKK